MGVGDGLTQFVYGQRTCVASDDRWLALRDFAKHVEFYIRSFWHCLNCEVHPERDIFHVANLVNAL